MDISVEEPWKVLGVDQTGCAGAAFAGFTLRKVKLSAAGVNVAERTTIDEGFDAVFYDKRGAGGKPGSGERALASNCPAEPGVR